MHQRSLKRLSSIRIQSKTRLLAFIAVILSFVLSTIASVISLRMEAEQRSNESNSIISDIVHEHVIDHLLNTIETARNMSKDEEFIDMLLNEDDKDDAQDDNIADYLRGVKLGLNYDSSFVVSEKSHKYYTSKGFVKVVRPGIDAHDIWYKKFLDKNTEYELDVDTDEHNSGRWTIFFNQRVFDKKGNFIGVCGVGIKMASLQNTFKKFEDSYGVKIDLVDSKGLVQVDSETNKIENDVIKGIAKKQEDSKGIIKLTSLEGRTRTVKYIPRIGWYLVVEDSKNFDSTIYMKVIMINVLLCLLMSSIIIFIFYYVMYKTGYLSEENTQDPLTGGHNKTAFEADVQRLREENAPNLCVVSADIIGIKAINDKYGHNKGDEVIKGANKCLEQVFSKYGFVYRTDGDEFTLLLLIDPFELEARMIELNMTLENWSKYSSLDLSLSIGYSSRTNYPYMSVDELISNAKEMLMQKQQELHQIKSFDEELKSN